MNVESGSKKAPFFDLRLMDQASASTALNSALTSGFGAFWAQTQPNDRTKKDYKWCQKGPT